MDGKKSTTPKPSNFSNDRFERLLAESREAIRVGKESLAGLRLPPDELTEEQNRGGDFLAEYYKDSEKRRKQFDKDLEERRKESREFQAKVHKVSMRALSRLESQVTERDQVREGTSVAIKQTEQRREGKQGHRRTLKEKLANPGLHDTATVKEIRDYVGLSKSKVYRLVSEGPLKKLPQPKKGSKVLVLVTSIADYLVESSE